MVFAKKKENKDGNSFSCAAAGTIIVTIIITIAGYDYAADAGTQFSGFVASIVTFNKWLPLRDPEKERDSVP